MFDLCSVVRIRLSVGLTTVLIAGAKLTRGLSDLGTMLIRASPPGNLLAKCRVDKMLVRLSRRGETPPANNVGILLLCRTTTAFGVSPPDITVLVTTRRL